MQVCLSFPESCLSTNFEKILRAGISSGSQSSLNRASAINYGDLSLNLTEKTLFVTLEGML